jgi:hypothetical protein
MYNRRVGSIILAISHPVKGERKCTMDKTSKEYREFLEWKKSREESMLGKLPVEKFVISAIEKLRGEYKGINTVFSGFNMAFKKYYGEGADPSKATQELIGKGIIEGRPVKKGTGAIGSFMIYKKGEMPAGYGWEKKTDDLLKTILG